MISSIGSVMILLAGVGVGVFRARELRARPRQIRALIQALSALEAQIVYTETPLTVGFRECVNGCSEDTITKLFRYLSNRLESDRRCSVSDAVIEVHEKIGETLSLGQAEWNVLRFLGEQLGKTDCRETEKQLALSVERLRQIEIAVIKDAEKKGKLAIYIGVCGALLMILMCI